MSNAEAARRAWLAIVRKSLASRGLADALIEAFDTIADDDDNDNNHHEISVREDWQTLVNQYSDIDGYQHLCASASHRFDLVPFTSPARAK